MTLTTTEELKHLASSDNANELTRRLARECLANREAQPVVEPYMYELWKFDETIPELERWFLVERSHSKLVASKGQKVVLLYTAPPAPAVPDGWIACTERMPEVGERDWRTALPVLVKCEIGVIPAYYGFTYHEGEQCFGFMESIKFGDASGYSPEQHENRLMMHVTHWMPLPAAPEGGN